MDALVGYMPADAASTHPDATDREQSWTCRITRQGARRYILHLSGSLHAGWAGRLAAGLAAHHISVVRATARRTSTRWTAEIAVDALEAEVEPSAIDFIALMSDSTPPPRGPLALTDFKVARTKRDVLVEVRAADAVGFLGRILLELAELGLYPHEMRVSTLAGEVRDQFRLQSADGELPPDGIVTTLKERLAKLVA
jgi:hypothetical protein